MIQATVIYISPLTTDDGKYNIAFNLMSDEDDYSDKYIKWPLSMGEEIVYHSEPDSNDNVLVKSLGRILTANFHEWEWGKTVTDKRFGERLRAWSKESKEYQVTLLCPEMSENSEYDSGTFRGIRLNDFHEALEYGITYSNTGLLIWGDGKQENTYFLECYGRSSKTSPADNGAFNGYTQNDVIFYAPVPWWQKTLGVDNFEAIDESSIREDNVKDYGESYETIFTDGYDYYPYDYLPDVSAAYDVQNTNYIGSKYIAYIYGPAYGPVIEISDDKNISVVTIGFSTVYVPSGAVLVVNSIDKTAIAINSDGSEVNVFGARDTDTQGQLWGRILGGHNTVRTSGGFNFQVNLVEERSEPKWPMV